MYFRQQNKADRLLVQNVGDRRMSGQLKSDGLLQRISSFGKAVEKLKARLEVGIRKWLQMSGNGLQKAGVVVKNGEIAVKRIEQSRNSQQREANFSTCIEMLYICEYLQQEMLQEGRSRIDRKWRQNYPELQEQKWTLKAKKTKQMWQHFLS